MRDTIWNGADWFLFGRGDDGWMCHENNENANNEKVIV